MSSFVFSDRFTIPDTSPLMSPRLHHIFYASLAFQHALYHLLSNTIFKGDNKEMLKKRCWILTTMASFIMCACSLPYLCDIFTSGFDMHALHPRTKNVAEPLAAYFVAYLISDLVLGSIFYPTMLNLSSGWIHHTAYTYLFSLLVHKGWSHLAALAAIFELPTLIMGLASIHPSLRSNTAFTGTFFATRVFFHLALLICNTTEYGRSAPGMNGTWGPAISLIATYPMHLWWGYKCICSIRRRMYKRKLAARQVQDTRASLAASAGQAFTGMVAPDISSAVNTPATTPGAGAIHETANFASTGPAHSAFAKAAAKVRPPVNLLLPQSRRRYIEERPLLMARRLSSKYINSKSVFTAPVAPDGAGPKDAEPFLAIRSPAEAKDRARRLIADAVRRVWLSAPATWRRQMEEEAGLNRLHRTVSSSGEEDEDSKIRRSIAYQKARVRRAILKAVRTAINGRDADGLGNVDRTLLNLDLGSLIPEFLGQDYEIREFPVERNVEGERGRRLVGQIRRRIEVARREVVVLD